MTAPADELIIRALWWNVAIAPLGSEKDISEERFNSVADTLVEMLVSLNFDAFCLGEVSRRLLERLESLLDASKFKVFNGVGRSDGVNFDSCVIYDMTKIAFIEAIPVVMTHVAANQKIAHKIVFKVVATGEPFFLFVLHWPSRLHHLPTDPYRHSLGTNLRTSLNQIFREFGEDVNLIALGDFNDEPCDQSMTTCLLASRDRNLVRKRSNNFFLYNPFWRFLSHPERYKRAESVLTKFGSYSYSSTEQVSESYVFDQMLFSSSFINKGPWHLNEDEVGIFDEFNVRAGKYVRLVASDHMPVFAEVRREM